MTIVPRGGKYGVRVRDRTTGRLRWLGTFPTDDEARRAQAEALIRPRRGRSITVSEWAAVWLSDYARAAPATQRTYRYATKRIVTDLDGTQLADVDRIAARRRSQEWPVSTTGIARTMFAGAIDAGLLDYNPFANLRQETPRGRKDIDALTEPQILSLAVTAREAHGDYGDEAAAMILVLAYTGMRPGELCALKRDDVDSACAQMTVRASVDGTGREKTPKNGRTRLVAIPPAALEAFNEIPARLDSPYVFHTPRGHRLNKGSLSYLWRTTRAAWVAQGNPTLDLYGLRHACATLLIQRGVPAYAVAQQLGHTDGGRLVMALYGHPAEARSRDLIGLAFGQPESQSVRRSRSA